MISWWRISWRRSSSCFRVRRTRHLKPGGIFITSGIINTKEEDVKDAFAANSDWEILEITHQNDWVSVTAKKRG